MPHDAAEFSMFRQALAPTSPPDQPQQPQQPEQDVDDDGKMQRMLDDLDDDDDDDDDDDNTRVAPVASATATAVHRSAWDAAVTAATPEMQPMATPPISGQPMASPGMGFNARLPSLAGTADAPIVLRNGNGVFLLRPAQQMPQQQPGYGGSPVPVGGSPPMQSVSPPMYGMPGPARGRSPEELAAMPPPPPYAATPPMLS
jgi:hypothetical protein